ncbi:ErfK/YbiS/YcfS/YnhG family protein [Carbonactinospora thermoautotrophica]|uniref:ErfK/YbiS/YcfS/YnhG family protein n=1 Tax=Carbonactinospora thermoautotrophica TaxID=1469144 RepID=A0A132MNX5_9ACTN|nr:Ig-like domain-containing protein [Carbonactinospora thermoautotrophica]KWW99435.1 ErfK/YbiS/YcfS/YnhG family protein [Carbonactinospora thermoautotrophica]
MTEVSTTDPGRATRSRLLRAAAALLIPLAFVSACWGGAPGGDDRSTASITVTPASGSRNVEPNTKVRVSAEGGKLTTVAVTDSDGDQVAGRLSGDGTTWTASRFLGPGERYTVSARAVDAQGLASTAEATFTTLTPTKRLRTMVSPLKGWTVGIGQPVVVKFKHAIPDRRAVQDALQVVSTPAVPGAWYWIDDRTVHWRPKEYWPAGTKVTLRVRLTGVKAGEGMYGEEDRDVSFTVGRAQVIRIDVRKHRMTVLRDGAVIRTFPITAGKEGFETRSGTKVILEKHPAKRMQSASIGISDPSHPDYYDLRVKYAMRVTWSGEFIHQAEWSTGAQGRTNVSHGCVGLAPADAAWLFENTRIGDPVEVTGTDREMELGNGYGDWNVPWSTWRKGNA